jgi:hypothetical protein
MCVCAFDVGCDCVTVSEYPYVEEPIFITKLTPNMHAPQGFYNQVRVRVSFRVCIMRKRFRILTLKCGFYLLSLCPCVGALLQYRPHVL